ncbi:outer membrane beta-barrel protein [Campylobacter troglodytis]|uniref:outer membrane beta-barrel protein n=1 Tax=Campylobacter troglodytis TaxID=654363 RepID=UPI001159936D|nr:hypothetical protein DMC01_03460 [Campylobacter troglodytis]
MNSSNIYANFDSIYNFASSPTADLGVFAGIYLGYANHSSKADPNDPEDTEKSTNGFDAGINLGLRASIASAHGIELFGRIGLMEQTKDLGVAPDVATIKLKQPYAIGLRYTFSF